MRACLVALLAVVASVLLGAQSVLAVNKCKICSTLMRNLEPKWENAKATDSQPFLNLPDLIDATCQERVGEWDHKEIEYCKYFNMRNPHSEITRNMNDLFGVSKLLKVSQYSCFGTSRSCNQFDCAGTKRGKSHSVVQYKGLPNTEKSLEVLCQCISADPYPNWVLPDFKACSFPAISCSLNLKYVKKANQEMIKGLVPLPLEMTAPKRTNGKLVPCPKLFQIPAQLQEQLKDFGWEQKKGYSFGVLDAFSIIKARSAINKPHRRETIKNVLGEIAKESPNMWSIVYNTYLFFQKHVIKAVQSSSSPLLLAYPEFKQLAEGIQKWSNIVLPIFSSVLSVKDAITDFIGVYRAHVAKVEAQFRQRCLDSKIQQESDLPFEELFLHWHRREAKVKVAKIIRGVLSAAGAGAKFFVPGTSAAVDLIANFFVRSYTSSKFNKKSIKEAKKAIGSCFDGDKILFESCSSDNIHLMRQLIAEDDHFASIFWDQIKYCKRTESCSPFWRSQIITFANYINFMEEFEVKASTRKLFPSFNLPYIKSFFQDCPNGACAVGDRLFSFQEEGGCPIDWNELRLKRNNAAGGRQRANAFTKVPFAQANDVLANLGLRLEHSQEGKKIDPARPRAKAVVGTIDLPSLKHDDQPHAQAVRTQQSNSKSKSELESQVMSTRPRAKATTSKSPDVVSIKLERPIRTITTTQASKSNLPQIQAQTQTRTKSQPQPSSAKINIGGGEQQPKVHNIALAGLAFAAKGKENKDVAIAHATRPRAFAEVKPNQIKVSSKNKEEKVPEKPVVEEIVTRQRSKAIHIKRTL